MERPVTTRILGKFQVTVPPEIRNIFDLQEGDLLDWKFDEQSGEIRVVAKRARVLTPRVMELVEKSRKERAIKVEPVPAGTNRERAARRT
jgi:bifunctional DNA-binding transcriptional regulator/antitoxin component of YhaV-PrlF toxin-antitoxin module